MLGSRQRGRHDEQQHQRNPGLVYILVLLGKAQRWQQMEKKRQWGGGQLIDRRAPGWRGAGLCCLPHQREENTLERNYLFGATSAEWAAVAAHQTKPPNQAIEATCSGSQAFLGEIWGQATRGFGDDCGARLTSIFRDLRLH